MAKLYDVVVKNRHVEGENIAIIEFESASSTVLALGAVEIASPFFKRSTRSWRI
ncbi:hypothetical protein ACT4UT_23205 [Bacillus sp. B-TM1]